MTMNHPTPSAHMSSLRKQGSSVWIPAFAGMTLLTSLACATPVGTITVINLSEQPLKGSMGEETFTVKPGKAWSKDDAVQGEHEVILGQDVVKVTVAAQRTTVIDPAATNCYVVADYRRQYGKNSNGTVAIVEQFEKQKTFTTQQPLLVAFGRALPKQIPEGNSANRLHQIDCALVSDKEKVADSIARIP